MLAVLHQGCDGEAYWCRSPCSRRHVCVAARRKWPNLVIFTTKVVGPRTSVGHTGGVGNPGGLVRLERSTRFFANRALCLCGAQPLFFSIFNSLSKSFLRSGIEELDEETITFRLGDERDGVCKFKLVTGFKSNSIHHVT